MKRVLFICGDLNPNDLGGAEVHIVEVIKKLAERGHKCEVFVGDDDGIKEIFTDKNITVHTVCYKKVKNFYSIAYLRAAWKVIWKFLKKNKVDILHAKQVYPYAYLGARLSKQFGIPLYVTVQNPLAYKEEMVVKGGMMKFVQKFWLWLAGRYVRLGLREADICGCVSQYSEKRAIDLGAGKTVIVPNGVDVGVFKPVSGRKDSYKVVTTSTLIPRNGIDVLIRAFSAVAAEFEEAMLEIAGEGPMEDELRSLVGRLQIEKQVKFLGTIPHKDVPELLQSADLFVRPSRAEGFGVSFIEAMACGVPVITCPSGGITDFVVDSETGLFVEPDAPDELASAMIGVLRDRGKLSNLKKNALKMVKKRYSWEKIVDQIEEAYNAVAK